MSDPAASMHFETRSWIERLTAGATSAPFRPWPATEDEASAADEIQDDEPEVSPPDAAELRAEGFAEGLEHGTRTAMLELSAEREAIKQLARSLEALRPEPTTALAALLAETVERLVREIAGNVEIDPVLLVKRAAAAASLIGDEFEPSRLLVNADDLPLLADANLPVLLVADPSLPRGSIRLESATGWVEDGTAVRLDRLRAALDRLGASE